MGDGGMKKPTGAHYSAIIGPEDYIRMMSQEHVFLRDADEVLRSTFSFYARRFLPSPTIVELGCGPLRITESLAREFPVTAVDWDPGFLKFSKRLLRQRKDSRITLVSSDICTYRHTRNVDIFVSQGVHHHIPKRATQDYLANVYRELSFPGIYIVSDEMLPHYDDPQERALRALVWYSYVISAAQLRGYHGLAREEAKTLLDDLAEGGGNFPVKHEASIELVLREAQRVTLAFRRVWTEDFSSLAFRLLGQLHHRRRASSSDPSLLLSRRDYKICHAEFEKEVTKAGFKIIGVETVGPVNTIGGFGIYVLSKAD